MRPIFPTRVRFGVATGPPNVSGCPKPASSMRMSRTFGASCGAFGPGMIVQSATDWSIVLADRAAEVLVGDRQHGAVGHELAHRVGETVLERLHALLVRLHDRLRERTWERLLHGEPLRVVERGDDPGRPRRQVLADLVVHLGLEPLVDELPDQAARDRACGRDREQRRRGQAYENTHAAAPLDALATAMVGRLGHGHGAVMGVRDEDRGLHLNLLVLDELRERVEVLDRLVDVRIARHQDIGRCVSHHSTPFGQFRVAGAWSQPVCTSSRPKAAAALARRVATRSATVKCATDSSGALVAP